VRLNSPHPWVNLEQFPVVVITFPATSTANETREMTNAMRHFALNVNEPIVIMSDISNVLTTDSEVRNVYVNFVRDMKTVVGRWVRGTAVITHSTFQKTLMNLHESLIGNTPYPIRAYSHREHALPWLKARIHSYER
jgi:hypothetical protein